MDVSNEENGRIVRMSDVRAARLQAERAAKKAAKRAAQPPREGVRPALYWGIVVALVFALAGGYSLVAAL